MTRRRHRRLAGPALVVLVLAPFYVDAQTPATPGITRSQLLDNERVTVTRATFAPGARETTHTHPNDIIVLQSSAGEIELAVADATTTGRQEPGKVWYIPRDTPHAAANVGRTSFDVIVITLK